MLEIGSRAQVFHGTAKQTSGGMKKKDIKKTDDGRYVSKKKSNNLNPALAARAEATKKIMDERKRMQGSKLYVGNLNYAVTEDQLKELFTQCGTVTDVVIISDKYTNRSKGFGFVEMSDPSEAQKAIETLNGNEFEGRTLKINLARPKTQDNRRGGGFNRE